MYLPLWGLAIILLLSLISICTIGFAFFDLAVRDTKGIIRFLLLTMLASGMYLSIWLGYEAILFNSRQE